MRRDLVRGLTDGSASRPPYLPLLGPLAARLAQVPDETYASDPQRQARALAESAQALHADAVVVGFGTTTEVAREAVLRVRPMALDLAVAAVLASPDVAAARGLCEAGIDLLFVRQGSEDSASRLRTLARACRFYGVTTVLISGGGAVDGQVPAGPDPDVLSSAERAGIDGVLVPEPTGDEPGIVGGGLTAQHVERASMPTPPRPDRFFWSFATELPTDLEPEPLAALGRRLTVAG